MLCSLFSLTCRRLRPVRLRQQGLVVNQSIALPLVVRGELPRGRACGGRDSGLCLSLQGRRRGRPRGLRRRDSTTAARDVHEAGQEEGFLQGGGGLVRRREKE